MSRFNKLTYVIGYCHYHLVWVPKYRLRVLEGAIKGRTAIRVFKGFSNLKKKPFEGLGRENSFDRGL